MRPSLIARWLVWHCLDSERPLPGWLRRRAAASEGTRAYLEAASRLHRAFGGAPAREGAPAVRLGRLALAASLPLAISAGLFIALRAPAPPPVAPVAANDGAEDLARLVARLQTDPVLVLERAAIGPAQDEAAHLVSDVRRAADAVISRLPFVRPQWN